MFYVERRSVWTKIWSVFPKYWRTKVIDWTEWSLITRFSITDTDSVASLGGYRCAGTATDLRVQYNMLKDDKGLYIHSLKCWYHEFCPKFFSRTMKDKAVKLRTLYSSTAEEVFNRHKICHGTILQPLSCRQCQCWQDRWCLTPDLHRPLKPNSASPLYALPSMLMRRISCWGAGQVRNHFSLVKDVGADHWSAPTEKWWWQLQRKKTDLRMLQDIVIYAINGIRRISESDWK